jgi:hypothetical protein
MHLASGTICSSNDRVWVSPLAHPTGKSNYRGTGEKAYC